MSGAAIDVAGLEFGYTRRGVRTPVLSGIDLTVPAGGYVSLMGASGAGKSTLLGLLGGLLPGAEGKLRVADSDVAEMDRRELARYRRVTVGFVFQHFGLVDVLTARENVEVALALNGVPRRNRAERAVAALEGVGLAARLDHLPHQLSGGEAQRVAIARSLVNEPSLLLADEPTGNLDEENSTIVLETIERQRKDRGCTLVIVTHHSEVANRAVQRLRLAAGKLVTP